VACSQCGAESKFENCRAGTLGNEACRSCFAPLSFGYSGARLEEVRLNSNKGGGAGLRDAAGKRVKMVRLWDVLSLSLVLPLITLDVSRVLVTRHGR